MRVLASDTQNKIDEKNKQIHEMEEYQETYRKNIAELEEKMAKQFYNNPPVASPEDRKAGPLSFLSPLNFSKLAFGA